jgi:hypothetical protein
MWNLNYFPKVKLFHFTLCTTLQSLANFGNQEGGLLHFTKSGWFEIFENQINRAGPTVQPTA